MFHFWSFLAHSGHQRSLQGPNCTTKLYSAIVPIVQFIFWSLQRPLVARMGQKRPKMEHFSHPGRLVDMHTHEYSHLSMNVVVNRIVTQSAISLFLKSNTTNFILSYLNLIPYFCSNNYLSWTKRVIFLSSAMLVLLLSST